MESNQRLSKNVQSNFLFLWADEEPESSRGSVLKAEMVKNNKTKTEKLCSLLTSWYVVPRRSVDDVVVSQEVLVVARSPVRVGHHLEGPDQNLHRPVPVCGPERWADTDLVGAGVRRGQPAEKAVVRGGRVLAGCPVAGHVERVSDHHLPTVEVGAEHEWDVLHPADDGSCLRRHLRSQFRLLL